MNELRRVLALPGVALMLMLAACDPSDGAAAADATGSADGSGGDADVSASDADALSRDGGNADDADAAEPGDSTVDLERYCDGRHVEIEARIDAVLAELTLEQKASLMHGLSPIPTDGTWGTGSVEELDIPGFHMLDGPRGLNRFSGLAGTAFPVSIARGATWNPELEREIGRTIGAELRLVGADTVLAPTVNILRHPRWGRAQETYGEDPLHVGVMGRAFVEGAQTHVMAVVKHYAANSIEDTRLEVNVTVDERTLREIYLPHFRTIVQDAGVAGVMTAYNQVNGDWSSESVHLVAEILREEWGFAGYTVSDFIWGMHDTARSLAAGLDVEMQYPQFYGAPVVAGVRDGTLDEALVDASVRRILRGQWCWRERLLESTLSERESEEALALAQEAARRGMVLLENRSGALPIDRAEAPRVAVVGSLADAENTGDQGSSDVRSSDVVTPIEGLLAAAGSADMVHVSGDLVDEESRAAVAAADVVVAVVGYSEDEEGEGQVAAGDRNSLALPDDDLALLAEVTALHDRVVAVVVGGSSFVTEGWGDEIEALVVAWYAGARGGAALAELLFGDANFTGRLPITFAVRDDDHPLFDNVSHEVEYGYFHGYRHLQREAVPPLYPFGYGLSYTAFSWSDAEMQREGESLTVSVEVTNVGDVAGTETVGVYVGSPDGGFPRAPRDLRGFGQVTLEPGVSATVSIAVPTQSLRRFDEATAAWVLEPGEYAIDVGPNVEDLSPAGTLTLP